MPPGVTSLLSETLPDTGEARHRGGSDRGSLSPGSLWSSREAATKKPQN